MDHPCGKCLRWPECNGVDWGSCPPSLAYIEKENTPTEMAKFVTARINTVHITGVLKPCMSPEEMARLLQPRYRENN